MRRILRILFICLLLTPTIKVEARDAGMSQPEELVEKVQLRDAPITKAGLIEKMEVCDGYIVILFYNNHIATVDFDGNLLSAKKFNDMGGVSFLHYLVDYNTAVLDVGKPSVYIILDKNLNIIQTQKGSSYLNTTNNSMSEDIKFTLKKRKSIVKKDGINNEIVIFEAPNAYFEDYREIYSPKIITWGLVIGWTYLIWKWNKERSQKKKIDAE